ncbi:hypothetical protein [Actinomyces sp. oral taxon 181]|uniref:hypothetical protein n=1 Tax=Actinomyces sp. oral taxon 181 TaxID=712121 RepID=UPI0002A3E434|nr:hypothetical protein [Actinomyces sp. oral taxon 181]EKY14907.1 hypothetical protein HMPREF9061_01164 [Actinomyces sp. oral taxon 181 str. F0379]
MNSSAFWPSSLSHDSGIALVVIFIGFLSIAAFKYLILWALKETDYSTQKKQSIVNKWGLLPYTALSIYSLMHAKTLLSCASECTYRLSTVAIVFLFLPTLATIAYIVTEVSFVQSAIIWILDKVIPGRRRTQNKPRHRK